jgi:hypothetical protein
MTHAIHRVERFEIVGPSNLALRFEDGTEQRIDFRPVLEGELFGPLRTPPKDSPRARRLRADWTTRLSGGLPECVAGAFRTW